MAEELGDRPEPKTQEPELHPGGADSLADQEKYGEWFDEPTVPDLDPTRNPAVEDTAPEEVKQPDDKSQAPDGEADDQEAGTERDPEAGQENEEGEPEEPA